MLSVMIVEINSEEANNFSDIFNSIVWIFGDGNFIEVKKSKVKIKVVVDVIQILQLRLISIEYPD